MSSGFSTSNTQKEKNMQDAMSLAEIRPGQCARVTGLYSKGNMRRRLLDIGLIENTEVKCVGRSPTGGMAAYLIRGAVMAIRSEDAKEIIVTTRMD